MLSLSARRVSLSAYRSNATWSRVLPFSASALRNKKIVDTGLHTDTVRTFTASQRNASVKDTATTNRDKSSAKSSTTGRTKRTRKLTPEQEAKKKLDKEKKAKKLDKERKAKKLDKEKKAKRAAALRAKRKAQAEKEREVAALKRKRLAEKKKKLAEAKKAREAKKPKIINPPPRYMNAFPLFVQETKKPIQEAISGWRNLSEEAKREYSARAKVVTEQRKEEFNVFMKGVTPSDIIRYNRIRRSMGKKGIHAKFPDRPLSSYLRFAQEFRTRPDQAGKRAVEVMKAVGAAWRSLTQEEKDQYKPKPTESTTV